MLVFKFGFERIYIEIPDKIADEIRRVCMTTYINGSTSFVFDFLTCRMYEHDPTYRINKKEPNKFNWIEIKTGSSELS